MNCYEISLYPARILLILIVAVLAGVTADSNSVAAELTKFIPSAKVEQTLPEKKEPELPAITIPNLITYGNRLSKDLIDMHSQLADINPPDNAKDQLAGIKKSMESLNWDTMMQQADSNLSYKRLSDTMALLNQLQEHLDSYTKRLNVAIELLSKQKKHWVEEENTLKIWLKQLRHADDFSLVKSTMTELEESIDAARKEIQKIMRESLVTLNDVSGMQVRLYTMKVTAGEMLEELRKQAHEQTSPTIFSAKFYSRLNDNVLSLAWQNASAELHKEARILRENRKDLILILAFPILLSLVFIKKKKNLQKNRDWSMLSERPMAFAIFTSLTFFFPWLSTSMPQIVPVCSLAYILSVMRLAGKQEENESWFTRFLYVLSLYLIIGTIVEVINLPIPLQRIYLLVGSCSWLVYVLWRIFSLSLHGNRHHRWLLMIISLALTGIIFAGMFGYDEFGHYLFRGVFLTIFLFISSVILFKTINILLEVVLALLPVVRRHSRAIVQSLRPLVFILCVLVFYSLTAVIWRMFPTSQDALSILLSMEIPLGSYTLTMWAIFMMLSIVYGTLLFSRAVQTILLDEALPRYNIHKGVQLSIARLVNYAILCIGCLVLLQVMGASLTSLTIFGGALSVGIGFGLQTIVNNFASGLILLFERPIKVGDTIQLATELGKVKKLGLRSTIIQTFDNAEIVIPNSDLISGQVTNWTLAERRARLKLSVGVAYGSDIEKVLKILLSVAEEHPMILATPPPRALLLDFGASSLDFELRVWVADFDDRRLVQSELNQEINSEFTDAGIEIPFPQTDLHLRTIDDEAADVLRMPEIGTPN
jgi:small-conductance mechanosensitive channel